MGNDGCVLFDDSYHLHDGSDSDLIGGQSIEQVIDLAGGDWIDEEGIVMDRNSMTVLIVDCDETEGLWWKVDHSLENGLYRVEIDDSEAMWSSFSIWDDMDFGGGATCKI